MCDMYGHQPPNKEMTKKQASMSMSMGCERRALSSCPQRERAVCKEKEEKRDTFVCACDEACAGQDRRERERK